MSGESQNCAERPHIFSPELNGLALAALGRILVGVDGKGE